jgi:hypothetical protein
VVLPLVVIHAQVGFYLRSQESGLRQRVRDIDLEDIFAREQKWRLNESIANILTEQIEAK